MYQSFCRQKKEEGEARKEEEEEEEEVRGGGTCKTHDDDDVYQYKRAIDSKKKKYETRIKQLPSQIGLAPDHPFPQCSQMGMATMGCQKRKKERKKERGKERHTHKDTRCYSQQQRTMSAKAHLSL
jgi:hypothetical protein